MPEVSPEDNISCPPELENLVKCVFCETNLTQDADVILGAQLLVCFHSVCKKCVDGWNESDKKSCPVCKFEVPKDVLPNKLLQEMVEKPHSESTRNGMCGMHNDTQASRWCHQCSSLVCDECVENHYKLKATSTHNLVDATGVIPTSDESLVEYRCKLHPTLQFDIFCLKCEMMTCRDCQLEHHRQHNEYEFIADHCKQFKDKLLEIQERICQSENTLEVAKQLAEKMEKDLLSSKEKVHKEITTLQQLLVRVVNDRCKELITKLNSKIDDEIRGNAEKIKATYLHLTPLRHCLQIVDLMLSKASDNTIIYSKKHLGKCFELYRRINIQVPNQDVRNHYYFEKGENLDNLVLQIKNIGELKTEVKHEGKADVYLPILEKFKLLNRRENNQKPTEKPLNPPARIQLRQDLQSPEGIKSMERVSTDSRTSASPEVGVMPHWHTPQGPPVLKVNKQTAPVAHPVLQTNIQLPQPQLQLPCSTVQVSTSAGCSITPIPPPQQNCPSLRRLLPQDTSAPAKKLVPCEVPQQKGPPVTMPAQPVQQKHPQFSYLTSQPVQTRTYQSTVFHQPSDPPRQLELQNMLGRNNVTLTPATPCAQVVALSQQQQMQQQQQLFQQQQLQQQQLQQQQQQLQQQQPSQQQPPPSYQAYSQQQIITYSGLQNITTYFPGSTHNPYPQL
uniref:E3 ubiquitin-protein ligase TRIM33 n=2 Tax=Lygus hesperus TaxID=30085 RepID=A0A0A9XE01_LYGHE